MPRTCRGSLPGRQILHLALMACAEFAGLSKKWLPITNSLVLTWGPLALKFESHNSEPVLIFGLGLTDKLKEVTKELTNKAQLLHEGVHAGSQEAQVLAAHQHVCGPHEHGQ